MFINRSLQELSTNFPTYLVSSKLHACNGKVRNKWEEMLRNVL